VLLTLSVKPPTLALLLEPALRVEDDAARSGHRARRVLEFWIREPVARSLSVLFFPYPWLKSSATFSQWIERFFARIGWFSRFNGTIHHRFVQLETHFSDPCP